MKALMRVEVKEVCKSRNMWRDVASASAEKSIILQVKLKHKSLKTFKVF